MSSQERHFKLDLVRSNALTDEDIVDRILAGERALFEVLMRRHNQRLYRAVRSVLRDGEAEDAMQQAYLSAFAHLDQFQRASSFSTWLVRIALNEALTRVRKQRRMIAVGDPDQLEGIEADTMAIERRAEARELVQLLEGVVDELPETYRTVFLLREVEGMSTAEAAGCLDLTESALKVRLHRAKALIKEALADRVGETAMQAFRFDATRCDRVVKAVLDQLV
jgi:RNA polymerase sigma-70 factor (ECF subfamily)